MSCLICCPLSFASLCPSPAVFSEPGTLGPAGKNQSDSEPASSLLARIVLLSPCSPLVPVQAQQVAGFKPVSCTKGPRFPFHPKTEVDLGGQERLQEEREAAVGPASS